MGRTEQDELSAGQIIYSCMQCADIFFLKVLSMFNYYDMFSLKEHAKLLSFTTNYSYLPSSAFNFLHCMTPFVQVDICQMGMDQRKVNVLAREYCDDTKRKKKPIILSHRN